MASVLVIEDGLVRPSDLQDSLHRSGHSVLGMTREHALCFAAKWQPDLVIVDAGLRGWVEAMTCVTPISSKLIFVDNGDIGARINGLAPDTVLFEP